jgi:uncharacterized membrane protein
MNAVNARLLSQLFFGLSLLGLLLVIFIPIFYFGDLPERIPTHFDASGRPDNWGERMTIWIWSGVAIAIWVTMVLLGRSASSMLDFSRIKEGKEELAAQCMMTSIHMMSAFLLWMFVYILWHMIQMALERSTDGLGVGFVWIVVIGSVVPVAWYLWAIQPLRKKSEKK